MEEHEHEQRTTLKDILAHLRLIMERAKADGGRTYDRMAERIQAREILS